jgi:folate-binding protein YgfZ
VIEALGMTPPEEPLAIIETAWNGVTLTVVRGDNPCVPNYEFWIPQEQAESFWAALAQAGAERVRDAALDAFRILCGIPKIGVDIRERTLPQETAQDRALNFNKGCYIGQEIVERIRARGSVHRTLTGFEVSGDTLPVETPIQVDGKDVGTITSTTTIPTDGGARVIALGTLRKEHLARDAAFEVDGATVRPVSLPFSNLIQQL